MDNRSDILLVEDTEAPSLDSDKSDGRDTPERPNDSKKNTSPDSRGSFFALSIGSAKAILKEKIKECETNILIEQSKLNGYMAELEYLESNS